MRIQAPKARPGTSQYRANALLDRLNDAQAKEVDAAVRHGLRVRDSEPLYLAQAIDTMRRTEYWRELGATSFAQYLESVCPSLQIVALAEGWGWLWRLREVKDALELVRTGFIEVEKLAILGEFLTPATWAYWGPLLIALPKRDIEATLEQYKRRVIAAHRANVFVPIVMPLEFYRKDWATIEARSEYARLLKYGNIRAGSHVEGA